ncbi:MAG TPA: hypothetical protein VF570_10275 [Pyrinomonadaceae bacterium]
MSKGKHRGRRKKGWKTGQFHWPGSHHDGHDHAGMAERLTPLEETEEFKDSPQVGERPGAADDTIRVDSKSVPMPEHLVDDEREGASIFRLEPVVFFIIVAMLTFIAFVTWQITLMPEK